LGSAVELSLAVLALVLSARWSIPIPGTDVPQTAQTLAVVVVGALLGGRLGSSTVILYILLGAAGLPVFAEGRSGLSVVTGPTGGFLLGFVVAAGIAGSPIARRWSRGLGPIGTPQVKVSGFQSLAGMFVMMLFGHAWILGMGWVWLARAIGAAAAFEAGVQPFLLGAAVKSLLGALLVRVAIEGVQRFRAPSRSS